MGRRFRRSGTARRPAGGGDTRSGQGINLNHNGPGGTVVPGLMLWVAQPAEPTGEEQQTSREIDERTDCRPLEADRVAIRSPLGERYPIESAGWARRRLARNHTDAAASVCSAAIPANTDAGPS